jgi:hypothetical protein
MNYLYSYIFLHNYTFFNEEFWYPLHQISSSVPNKVGDVITFASSSLYI